MPDPVLIDTDFAVIGAGMTGMSAALFALRRGLRTLVIGGPGELAYAAGPWDLLGVHPIERGYVVTDPWMGIEALAKDLPRHPYARIREGDLRAAFAVVLEAFRDGGYPYTRLPDGNCEVITSLGTPKRTYCLPHTMWNGVEAWRERETCLLVDFEGMKDFSARQIATTLSDIWPGLQPLRLVFPGSEALGEVSTELLARCVELPDVRSRLIELILPHVADHEAVAFPAMLGQDASVQVVADLEHRLGVPVFEVPSPPVSVPGLRIRSTFERLLRERGATLLLDDRVTGFAAPPDGGLELHVEKRDRAYTVLAQGALLATGRFLGGGLAADRAGIRETIFDLPVSQPGDRASWHRRQLLDRRGHPINQAGLEVDERFRPLNAEGQPAFPTLHAAGSLLAHQDWMRMKCGAGLALTTSYAAVDAFVAETRGTRGEP